MSGAAIPTVSTELTFADRLGHVAVRWGIGRMRYRVAPGLYRVGSPGADSQVLVTANYRLTFDKLRAELRDLDAWLLVLDTKGINVWCAAGKGIFGTAEVVRQVRQTGLHDVVTHRRLIVPQLAAPGVAAHEVRRLCGFRVVYGPVRARDIKGFLAAGRHATEEMRRVRFPVGERLALTGMELVPVLKYVVPLLVVLVLLGAGPSSAWLRDGSPYVAAVLAGTVLTPLLLPWIPGRAFSLKGALVGVVAVGATLPLGGFRTFSGAISMLLVGTAIASYLAMNFTGSTTFTSPSGVEREMRRALPLQLGAILLAVALQVVRSVTA